jgi:hypothetical protein
MTNEQVDRAIMEHLNTVEWADRFEICQEVLKALDPEAAKTAPLDRDLARVSRRLQALRAKGLVRHFMGDWAQCKPI